MAADAAEHVGRAPEASTQGKRRRRRPNPTEQAKREAWGREYGGIMRELKRQRAQQNGG